MINTDKVGSVIAEFAPFDQATKNARQQYANAWAQNFLENYRKRLTSFAIACRATSFSAHNLMQVSTDTSEEV